MSVVPLPLPEPEPEPEPDPDPDPEPEPEPPPPLVHDAAQESSALAALVQPDSSKLLSHACTPAELAVPFGHAQSR